MKIVSKLSLPFTSKGVALFVSILISMSLAVTAMASMARLSETTHQTGKTLQEKRMLMFAESAANIVNAKVELLIAADISFADTHIIHGLDGEESYLYYPREVTLNPGTTGTPTLFGYRANARLFAGPGDTPPGMQTGVVLPANAACYDITIDVIEIIYVPSGTVVTENTSVETASYRYFKGKMKTVGIISCFEKG